MTDQGGGPAVTDVPDAGRVLSWANEPPTGKTMCVWLRRCAGHGARSGAPDPRPSAVVDWLTNDTDANLAFRCGCVLRLRKVPLNG